MNKTAWLLVAALLLPAASHARRPTLPSFAQTTAAPALAAGTADRAPESPPFRAAAASTTFLHVATFDAGGACNLLGWTAVDMTAQTGDYFHVDDYAGLNFGALAGAKSLWCGARWNSTGVLCSYQTLPGYGNNWNQAWCTRTCVAVTGDLDVSLMLRLDTEPDYDALTLEYTTDCTGGAGWTVLDGGVNAWDGIQCFALEQAYGVGGAPSVRVRFRFASDGMWSDEDGLWDTDGAVHIDALAVEALAPEDFEDEATGAASSNDWVSCAPPGYGVFAGLVSGTGVLQNRADSCTPDVSCLWAFFVGSASDYACGGYPSQRTIPYRNANGQYFHNEIWSPPIDLAESGATLILEYQQYNDFPVGALVFPTWSVRAIAGGCPRPWISPVWVPDFGSGWTRQIHPIGPYVNFDTATEMQVSLGVVDMCSVWCGIQGSGECHSHAPLYDDVRVYRVDTVGPQWSIRDIDQFQDNFAEIAGPSAGRTRADMANDIAPGNHANSIIPGDSSVVAVWDPLHGIGADPVFGGAAVYCYVSVFPRGQPGKSGPGLSDDAARWPVVGSWTDGAGIPWTCLRLDSTRVGAVAQPDVYCVDLNDSLFEAGDTVFFFYSARSNIGLETVAFGSNLALTGDDRNQAASEPAEFTCLPAGGPARGADMLYVDGMDGRGAQPYWDTAFAMMGLTRYIDRYDVRGPTSAGSNRPAGRVKDISQLVPAYHAIFWDCGDLSVTLGDGSGTPEKTDDYELVNSFLANLSPWGGIYLGGDDIPSQLAASTGADAIVFRSTYIPHTLVTGSHGPGFGISPIGVAVTGGAFVTDPSFVIYGGCPLVNDFDVMQPAGSSQNQITYGPGTGASGNGALLLNITGNARVLFAGFSFIYIRDDEQDGTLDRAAFFYDVRIFLDSATNAPTPVASAVTTSLSQNHPNPFNPQTTIGFSLARRGAVTLSVYDVAGRRVRTLLDESRGTGPHSLSWDGRNDAGQQVASGVYFCRLVAGDFAQTRKMVLLK